MEPRDLDQIAEKLADNFPKSHWFSNRVTIGLLILFITIAFSTGLLWAKFKDVPKLQETVEEMKDATVRRDSRLDVLEDRQQEIRGDLRDIKVILMRMERKL